MHLKCGGQKGKQRARIWRQCWQKTGGCSSTVAGGALRGNLGCWRREGKKRNCYLDGGLRER